jgi:hypothetical protein
MYRSGAPPLPVSTRLYWGQMGPISLGEYMSPRGSLLPSCYLFMRLSVLQPLICKGSVCSGR